jgi:formamidopyrimidine-DNA glycosylase
MPELPEVETIRRQLCAAGVEGRLIEKVHIEWPRTVEPLSPAQFRRRLKNRTVQQLTRHGKWLIFRLGRALSPKATRTSRRDVPANLLVHLRMTGGFYLSQGALKKGPHDRAILQLSGGLNLHFRDPRKFGRWRLEPSLVGQASLYPESLCHKTKNTRSRIREARPTINELGPDALTVTKKEFFRCLPALSDANGGVERGKRNKMLKALLLDQTFVAGVGNIYADEALFEARLDPRRKSSSLTEDEISKLWKAVRRVIEAGVKNNGTSLGAGQGNYTDLNGEAGGHREKVKVYGRSGQPCPVCGRPLHKTQIAQRTTVFCAHCQK